MKKYLSVDNLTFYIMWILGFIFKTIIFCAIFPFVYFVIPLILMRDKYHFTINVVFALVQLFFIAGLIAVGLADKFPTLKETQFFNPGKVSQMIYSTILFIFLIPAVIKTIKIVWFG